MTEVIEPTTRNGGNQTRCRLGVLRTDPQHLSRVPARDRCTHPAAKQQGAHRKRCPEHGRFARLGKLVCRAPKSSSAASLTCTATPDQAQLSTLQ